MAAHIPRGACEPSQGSSDRKTHGGRGSYSRILIECCAYGDLAFTTHCVHEPCAISLLVSLEGAVPCEDNSALHAPEMGHAAIGERLARTEEATVGLDAFGARVPADLATIDVIRRLYKGQGRILKVRRSKR